MASGADCRALVQDSLVAWLNESKYSLRPRVNLRAAKSLHASFGSSDGSIEYDHPKLTASLDRYTFKPRKRIDAEEKNAQMEQLIEQLPTLNEKSLGSGKSGLSWAISSGYSHCVLKLLREGADPNKCDKSGRFPLHDCALLLRASTAIDDMSAVLNIAGDKQVVYDCMLPYKFAWILWLRLTRFMIFLYDSYPNMIYVLMHL
jgi:hypothetical protein